MLNSEINIPLNNISKPDYDGLIRFLIEPLLESPELLYFDCENIPSTKRVWIRLAFEDNDKGKIYGRGGRNIQAIRHVLQTAAQMAGDTIYLEVYEDPGRTRMKSSRPDVRQPQPNRESRDNHNRRPIKRSLPIEKPQF